MRFVEYKTQDVIDRHPQADIIRKMMVHPTFKHAFGQGAWIAGGFARVVFTCQEVTQYFNKADDTGIPGDVDFFFDTHVGAASTIKQLIHTLASYGGNAKETNVLFGGMGVKVQIVDKPELIMPIRDQLDRFDFTNVMCAFNEEVFVAPDNLLDLEQAHTLEVRNSTSPYLASRIRKYMRRGFTSVTDESRVHITDWIIKALQVPTPRVKCRYRTPRRIRSGVRSRSSACSQRRPASFAMRTSSC